MLFMFKYNYVKSVGHVLEMSLLIPTARLSSETRALCGNSVSKTVGGRSELEIALKQVRVEGWH